MHCFCCYGAFFFWCVFFNLTIHDSRLSSVSKRGLWIVKDPRRLPATQRAWFFFVFLFPSGLGPPALSRSALLAASAPAVKCDHSAPLGPGLGAVWEPNPWRAAFDGGGAHQHFERGRAASLLWDRTLVYASSLPELSRWTEHIWQAAGYVMASLCTLTCFANLLSYD